MQIKLYNTLTRKKEVFKPIKSGRAGIYTCGPTVYWYQHVGNLRSYVFSDILKRVLLYNGLKVKHVINVTDVGHLTSDSDFGADKVEEAAKKERKSVKDISEFYFGVFLADLKKLNVLLPDFLPKASEHINEQIELIKKLRRRGYTYETSDGIYFKSTRFKDYGKLAKLNVKGLKKGKRVSSGEKKHKTDFALWKFSAKPGERQQEWDSPWGLGFPGWHIECSAMSMKYLGKHFDIHTGGEDHIPIHHTNEIAQSEAVTKRKFVNYWMHGAFLIHKGEKVSKSTGGLYTISELERLGYNPLHFRYLSLLTHYRKQLSFSLENLDSAKNTYERAKRKIVEIKSQKHKGPDRTKQYEKEFLKAINDDLNIPRALDIFWKVLDDFGFSPGKKIRLLERFDLVLGLGIKDMVEEDVKVPKDVGELIGKRETARKKKMWAKADILRQRIKEKGFVLEDTPKGLKVRRA